MTRKTFGLLGLGLLIVGGCSVVISDFKEQPGSTGAGGSSSSGEVISSSSGETGSSSGGVSSSISQSTSTSKTGSSSTSSSSSSGWPGTTDFNLGLLCTGNLCSVGKGGYDSVFKDTGSDTTISLNPNYACVVGTTTAHGSNFQNWGANLNFDLNSKDNAANSPVQLIGPGIEIQVSSIPAGGLRVAIAGPADDAGLVDYCAVVPSTATQTKAFIPWSAFSSQCWLPGGGGNRLSGPPVTNAMRVNIMAAATKAPFDFCVEALDVAVLPNGSQCISQLGYPTGYVRIGSNWQGYSYDFLASGTPAKCTGPATISPVCGAAGCNPPLIGSFSGSLAGCSDYSSNAGYGWNVNQDEAGGPRGTWTVPGSGSLTLNFTASPGTPPLQVTVEEANATDATRYCAVVKSGVPISWTDFKSYCWETPATRSTSAVGKSIVNASLTIPGTTVPNDFDLCLQSVTLQ